MSIKNFPNPEDPRDEECHEAGSDQLPEIIHKRTEDMKKKPAAIVRLPWEKQPGEGPKFYDTFKTYRDLGPTRTLAKATEALYPGYAQEKGKSIKPYVAWMSTKFKWRPRAEAFDREIDRQQNQQQIVEIRKMCRNHANAATLLVQKGLAALAKITPEQLAKSPNEVLKYIVEAAKLERLSRGVAETIEQVQHVSIEHTIIEQEDKPEQMQAVLAILEQIGAVPKMQTEIIDVELVYESNVQPKQDVSEGGTGEPTPPENDEVHPAGADS